ncbi:MAG: hypothetical protein NTZ17_12840 [Phycisphaerae bacterium]|nr:hypothetical protein [Phycisphaerae bacterium]
MVGVATIGLALLLIVYGFVGRPRSCLAPASGAAMERLHLRKPALVPVMLGLITGVNVCPPFLMAFGNAAQLPGLGPCLLFFAAFSAGTSVYHAPLPLVGMAAKREVVKSVGRLVAVTGLHVHPLYTGGAVAQTIDHGRYQTLIHRPVFDGLVGQREYGILQIRWQPKDANLPERIDEAIDLDADNTSEFTIRLNTKTNTADLEPSGERFLSIDEVIPVANARVVRISLKRR